MKKRPNKAVQHAPRALGERELQAIMGGGDPGPIPRQEINRNLK